MVGGIYGDAVTRGEEIKKAVESFTKRVRMVELNRGGGGYVLI